MSDLTSIADHANQQSDRWLFLFLLVVVFASVLVLWRWMVSDRDKVSERLIIITDRHISQAEHLATVVANNTQAMVKVEGAMLEVQKVLGNCKNK